MKFTYEEIFRAKREDGRMVESFPAQMELLRRYQPILSLPKELTRESFADWQQRIKAKAEELLAMPTFTEQPTPVLLHTDKRDGYRVEKWEFYPDDVSAVPMLLMIPDEASEAHPVPAVMCFPGSEYNKESEAAEPLLERSQCQYFDFPERNRMGYHIVKNGMVAAVFDPVGIGELAPKTGIETEHGGLSRQYMSMGLLMVGMNYAGLAVFQKLCFLPFLKSLPYVDNERLGVSGHSLGSGTALYLGVICDEFKAIVFNDFTCDTLKRYTATTEYEEMDMFYSPFWPGTIPGEARYYSNPDLLASLAPRYLTINEGGADEVLETVRRAYRCVGAEDRLSISYYPEFSDPASRTMHGTMPDHGLSVQTHFDWSYVNASDHSYRAEPSIALLKRAFSL